MVPDYRREAYALLTEAARGSNAADLAGVLWDCAASVGVELKKSDEFRVNCLLVLNRVIRRIRSAKDVAALQATADQAAELVGRISRPTDILR